MNNDNLTYDIVYIVDDDKVINLTHFQIIKKTGIAYETRVFSNPMKALADLTAELKLSNKNILVLLDISMERINGFEFLDSLSLIKVKRILDIVMVTSSIDYRSRLKSMEHSLVKGYINKPLTKKQIFEFVHNNTLKSV